MSRLPARALLACLMLAAAGCEQPANQPGDGHDAGSGAPRGVATATAGSDAGAHDGPREASSGDHAATDHATGGEQAQALLPIMQRLGTEMTALTHGLMMDDSATVARSADAIARHAPISADEVERIHTTLGANMAAFEAVDESVHVAALRLHEAARSGNLGLVVQRLGDVQRGCVSCHTQFRDQLRTTGGGL